MFLESNLPHSDILRHAIQSGDQINRIIIDIGDHLVTLGVPDITLEKDFDQLQTPDTPHIFSVDSLQLVSSGSGENCVWLHDQIIIMAHGRPSSTDLRNWQFADGQSVVDTTAAYNDFAHIHSLPPITVIVSCRETYSENSTDPVPFASYLIPRNWSKIPGVIFQRHSAVEFGVAYAYAEIPRLFATLEINQSQFVIVDENGYLNPIL